MMLETESLSVTFRKGKRKTTQVTHEVNISVGQGEVVALVGESGSGKSVTAMEIAGLNPRSAASTGRVLFDGKDVLSMPAKKRRALLRTNIGVIFQDPLSSLNPVYTIGTSMGMSMQNRIHDKKRRRERAIELLEIVSIPEPQKAVDRYPHELSGGQRQRVMIAMAIDVEPKLLIADEPTTALDVTIQADILDLLDRLKDTFNMGVLLITHDMGVVANSADRMYVMKDGRVREEGPVERVFSEPQDEYTKLLFAAVPKLDINALDAPVSVDLSQKPDNEGSQQKPEACLIFKDVSYFYSSALRKEGRKALDKVSFEVPYGRTVGLVGESGSGKSTIGRIAADLLTPQEGEITVKPPDEGPFIHSMVFQDPASSLDPRRTIGESIAAPLIWGREKVPRKRALERAEKLLDRVHLPKTWSGRLPHELSGGQRQRVGVARGLIVDPDLLVADEPTSALDVSVQAAVLELFVELQAEFQFSCLFISHDLAVVEQVANTVVVLNKGRVEEIGGAKNIIYKPRSEYTRQLIRSVPLPDPVVQRERKIRRA